jgi:methylglutaconyl-CoA hydratase
MTLAPDPVLLEVSPEGVAIVTLNAPAKHNAFDEIMIAGLAETFETLKGADHVRIVFLRGAGEVFCAGPDREWLTRGGARDLADNEADALALARMLRHLHELPQLTVALVSGAALDCGAGLVAACDVAVALKNATFGFNHARLGLSPAAIAPFVVEAVGRGWAKALLMTAERFDAAFAEKMGLVHYAVDSEAEMQAIMEHLTGLAMATAPGAAADIKTLVAHLALHRIDDALSKECAHRAAARLASPEGKEGLAAFLAKRKPEWSK